MPRKTKVIEVEPEIEPEGAPEPEVEVEVEGPQEIERRSRSWSCSPAKARGCRSSLCCFRRETRNKTKKNINRKTIRKFKKS
jgi:hypothetical protein